VFVPGSKVLIVHEDETFMSQLTQALSASSPGTTVATALSAPRALGMLGQELPDVMVVDAELTGMDGYALTQQVKSDPRSKDVPVIIVSLAPNETTALKARQVGASAHLAGTGAPDPIIAKIIQLSGGEAAPVPAPAQGVPAGAGATVPVGGPMPAAGIAPGGPAPAQPSPQPVPVGAPAGAPAGAPQPQPAAAAPPGYGAPQPVSAPAPGGAPPAYGAPQPVKGSEAAAAPTGAPGSDVPHIDDLLRLMLQRGGSDLHITVGSPPGIRLRGEIISVENMKPLTPRDTMEMILSLLSEEQRRRFETELELDFAYSIPGVSRFRANVFQQRNSMGAVFRVIPIKIPTMDELALPKVCRFLADRPRGLVLVTGPTGSGKSTTLAAMIDHINANKALHIITLEDPIEFMHRNKKAYVNQREVGEDTHSFAAALKRVLRQDPDVILVGEMRDLETISAAITAAETGHLVLATLHTTGGPETVDRIIDVFPPHQQQQVRMQLSNTLEGVLSQVLLRSTDGRSRVMAMEIMLGIPAIANLIREGKTHQMETIIQGGAQLGMQTLDQHLKNLLNAGRVTFDEAISKAKSPRELADMVGRKI
jgi:twitching motility protein PilT